MDSAKRTVANEPEIKVHGDKLDAAFNEKSNKTKNDQSNKQQPLKERMEEELKFHGDKMEGAYKKG